MSMKCKIYTTWHLVSFLKTPTTQNKTQGHHVFGQWMSHRFFEIHGAFPTCFFPQKPQKPMDFGSFSGYGEHEHAVAGFFMTCCPSLFTGRETGRQLNSRQKPWACWVLYDIIWAIGWRLSKLLLLIGHPIWMFFLFFTINYWWIEKRVSLMRSSHVCPRNVDFPIINGL